MGRVLFRLLLSPIGWVILHLRYRDSTKVKEVLKIEYGNDYSFVASQYVMSLFIFIGIAMLLVLIVMAIYSAIIGRSMDH